MNTYKSVVCLYTSNEQTKNEPKKTIPFTKASKIIKYLGINLTKYKTYTLKTKKHCWKKIKDDINKWKNFLRSWIGRFNLIVKPPTPADTKTLRYSIPLYKMV